MKGRISLTNTPHPYETFREKVHPVLNSKLEEFRILGYERITENELWEYLIKKVWRKPKEGIHIHELVSDIFEVKVSDVVHFRTITDMQTADWFSPEGAEELKKLLE